MMRANVCIPAQVLMEFIHVITWQRLEKPLSLKRAIRVVQDYLDTGILIIYQPETQIQTLLTLLSRVATRKKMFDVALAAIVMKNEK
jgi:predicted nucleic acid-binding protein